MEFLELKLLLRGTTSPVGSFEYNSLTGYVDVIDENGSPIGTVSDKKIIVSNASVQYNGSEINSLAASGIYSVVITDTSGNSLTGSYNSGENRIEIDVQPTDIIFGGSTIEQIPPEGNYTIVVKDSNAVQLSGTYETSDNSIRLTIPDISITHNGSEVTTIPYDGTFDIKVRDHLTNDLTGVWEGTNKSIDITIPNLPIKHDNTEISNVPYNDEWNFTVADRNGVVLSFHSYDSPSGQVRLSIPSANIIHNTINVASHEYNENFTVNITDQNDVVLTGVWNGVNDSIQLTIPNTTVTHNSQTIGDIGYGGAMDIVIHDEDSNILNGTWDGTNSKIDVVTGGAILNGTSFTSKSVTVQNSAAAQVAITKINDTTVQVDDAKIQLSGVDIQNTSAAGQTNNIVLQDENGNTITNITRIDENTATVIPNAPILYYRPHITQTGNYSNLDEWHWKNTVGLWDGLYETGTPAILDNYHNLVHNNIHGHKKRFTGDAGGYYDEVNETYHLVDGTPSDRATVFPNEYIICHYTGLGFMSEGLVLTDIGYTIGDSVRPTEIIAGVDALVNFAGYSDWRCPTRSEIVEFLWSDYELTDVAGSNDHSLGLAPLTMRRSVVSAGWNTNCITCTFGDRESENWKAGYAGNIQRSSNNPNASYGIWICRNHLESKP